MRLTLLTDKMNSLVMRLDIDGTILSMNPYAGRFSALKAGRMRGTEDRRMCRRGRKLGRAGFYLDSQPGHKRPRRVFYPPTGKYRRSGQLCLDILDA